MTALFAISLLDYISITAVAAAPAAAAAAVVASDMAIVESTRPPVARRGGSGQIHGLGLKLRMLTGWGMLRNL